MWRITIFLLISILLIPYVTYMYDEAPSDIQWEMIIATGKSYLILATICFLISTFTKNYSQVDKLWSIAPIYYAWHIAYIGNFEDRMVLMAILISVWGVRLTFNFGRRGGYSWKFWSGEEDYRWSILRAKPEFSSKIAWSLFNLFFISFYQMGLVLIINFPMIKSYNQGNLSLADYILAAIVIGLIIVEFIADNQQYRFQTEKWRRIKSNENLGEYAHGFTNVGLWKYMRHPNYMAEQSIWFVIYLFSAFASESAINWSIAGTILLILLFFGSSEFSEGITLEKYPAYKKYKEETGRYFPKLKSLFRNN